MKAQITRSFAEPLSSRKLLLKANDKETQMLIQNPVKYLRWSFFAKIVTVVNCFRQNIPSKKFDRVLSMLLKLVSQPAIACSKITIKTLKQGVNMFKVSYKNFQHILHLVLVFQLLTLSRQKPNGVSIFQQVFTESIRCDGSCIRFTEKNVFN